MGEVKVCVLKQRRAYEIWYGLVGSEMRIWERGVGECEVGRSAGEREGGRVVVARVWESVEWGTMREREREGRRWWRAAACA
mgnify:CR=1 FL=1